MKRQISIPSIVFILIAMLFLEYGFWQLSYLTNFEIATQIRNNARIGTPQFSAEEITSYAVIISTAYFAGFFIAGILSFILSKRKRVDLYESLISFGIFWMLAWSGLTSWKYFSIVARLPGSGLKGYWFFVVNGSVWILFGVAILMARRRFNVKRRNQECDNR